MIYFRESILGKVSLLIVLTSLVFIFKLGSLLILDLVNLPDYVPCNVYLYGAPFIVLLTSEYSLFSQPVDVKSLCFFFFFFILFSYLTIVNLSK